MSQILNSSVETLSDLIIGIQSETVSIIFALIIVMGVLGIMVAILRGILSTIRMTHSWDGEFESDDVINAEDDNETYEKSDYDLEDTF